MNIKKLIFLFAFLPLICSAAKVYCPSKKDVRDNFFPSFSCNKIPNRINIGNKTYTISCRNYNIDDPLIKETVSSSFSYALFRLNKTQDNNNGKLFCGYELSGRTIDSNKHTTILIILDDGKNHNNLMHISSAWNNDGDKLFKCEKTPEDCWLDEAAPTSSKNIK